MTSTPLQQLPSFIIETRSGDRWRVTEVSRFVLPLAVEHADPWMRGSMLEARMNLALRVHGFKAELHEALPRWLRDLIPFPRAWWIVIMEEA